MTWQQQAHGLIERLPEESVRLMVEVMLRMEASADRTHQGRPIQDDSSKKQAYREMQDLRRRLSAFDFSEEDRAAGLESKYGLF